MAAFEKCAAVLGENKDAFRLCAAAAGNSHVMLLCLEPGAKDRFEAWLIDGLERLVMRLQALFEHPVPKLHGVVVVVWDSAGGTMDERVGVQACWEAVRGIVHTLTMECRADRVRLNAALADASSIEQLRELLAYLGDGATGFVAGGTFDVRGWL